MTSPKDEKIGYPVPRCCDPDPCWYHHTISTYMMYISYRKGVHDAFTSLGQRRDERVMVLIRAEQARLKIEPPDSRTLAAMQRANAIGGCTCCYPDCIDPKCTCQGGDVHSPHGPHTGP